MPPSEATVIHPPRWFRFARFSAGADHVWGDACGDASGSSEVVEPLVDGLSALFCDVGYDRRADGFGRQRYVVRSADGGLAASDGGLAASDAFDAFKSASYRAEAGHDSHTVQCESSLIGT
ncbi:Uncharacterised protein [Mycobacteroides abscessus subsp. abscessus]|nr:Uncharacterised protein [Mycobacteroides abscessus subsp. abscessus]